jgi:hypothetical protein
MDELYFLNTEQTGTVSLTFRMKLVKYVLVSRSDFPGVSGRDSEGKISCAAWEK